MTASRPNVFTLLARMAEAAVSGGMLWLAFFCAVVLVYMHINHMPAYDLLVLVLFGLVALAVIRGMKSWQADIEEYRRSLTEYRMALADVHKKTMVKKDIAWDRK